MKEVHRRQQAPNYYGLKDAARTCLGPHPKSFYVERIYALIQRRYTAIEKKKKENMLIIGFEFLSIFCTFDVGGFN